MRALTFARTAFTAVVPALAASTAACAHQEPPAPEGSPSVALPDVPVSASPASLAAPAALPPPARGASPLPALSADPSRLPQTRDVPAVVGPAFEDRVRALWTAIVDDDPERAMSFFFPLGAYEQVKDIGNPDADWKHRLVAAYAKDIHALHARLPAD